MPVVRGIGSFCSHVNLNLDGFGPPVVFLRRSGSRHQHDDKYHRSYNLLDPTVIFLFSCLQGPKTEVMPICSRDLIINHKSPTNTFHSSMIRVTQGGIAGLATPCVELHCPQEWLS